ncbi:MAG: glutaminyl-peptide cyclotransferase, partial [Candidatus Adiutrix sp.]|nr:glutaminyl-peptide cyclotransferase [Candidatus Adiutrix sp.]
MGRWVCAIMIWLLISGRPGSPLAAAPVYPLDLQNSRPHSTESYTQGLFFLNHDLYESAGLYGRSSLTRWSFGGGAPARIVRRRELADNYFAEGATAAGGEIYLLTWREHQCLVLDPETLMIKREVAYSGEGWGLAWAGGRLWRSDGSAHLYPHRAGDFAPAGEPLTVRDEGVAIDQINELEWDPLTGLLLANIYGRDQVAAIDLADGRVR